MVFQGGRSVVRLPQLTLQYLGNRHTALSSSCVERVPALYNVSQSQQYSHLMSKYILRTLVLRRNYAEGVVSRPKAHTGRTTAAARKAPTTSGTTAAKEPAPKKTTPKAVPNAKSAKPGIKAKPKPAKKKAKPKPKPKVKKANVLTEAQKSATKKKQLKSTALEAPRGLSSSSWKVFLAEKLKGMDFAGQRSQIGSVTKEASAEFKQLTPERVEHYNHIANQNKIANATFYRQWIESYTPATIREANNARLHLRRLGERVSLLRDPRQVTRVRVSYLYFHQQRLASGDFRGLKIEVAGKLIGEEWKTLSTNEKKPFEDLAAQDRTRYVQEMKTVMNKDVRTRKAKA